MQTKIDICGKEPPNLLISEIIISTHKFDFTTIEKPTQTSQISQTVFYPGNSRTAQHTRLYSVTRDSVTIVNQQFVYSIVLVNTSVIHITGSELRFGKTVLLVKSIIGH